jgi:PAS domain S-box-containing protein
MALLSRWWMSTEKKKLRQTKELEKMVRRGNNKQRTKPTGKRKAVAFRRLRQSNHTQPKMTKRTSSALQKFSNHGAVGPVNKNGAPIHSMRPTVARNPKNELEAAIQRFVDLYDFAPVAYVSFDRSGRIEEANLTATQLLGEPRDRLIGRPFAFYVRGLDLFMQHLLSCRTSEQQVRTELQLKTRKGELVPAQLLSTPITSTTRNGALLYQTALIDLRERKRHEQQLAEQARLLNLTNDAIIVRDPNDRITYWNNGATKIYGYRPEEVLGKVSHDLLKTEHPEPLPKIYQKLQRDNYWEGEVSHISRDGSRLIVFSRWAVDSDARGNRSYVLETNNDITARKATEKALVLASRLSVEHPAPIIRLKQGEIVTFANPAATKLLRSFRVKVGDTAPAQVKRIATTRERTVAEMNFGGRIYQVLVAPVLEGDYVNLYFTDVTARKRSEQQQQALYQFAQQQNAATSFSEIYEAALDAIRATLHCDRASILLFDEKKVMRFVAWRDLSNRYRQAVEGHLPWKVDARTPKPVCISDVDLADVPQKLKKAITSEGIRAASFIPMVAEEKLIGKFMTYYNEPHFFSDSELALSLAIARQLTLGIQNKRAEEALRESEERLRAIVNQSNAGIASCDLAGRFSFTNRKFREMLGYTETELAARTLFTITHAEDVDLTKRRFREMVQREQPLDMDKRYICKDGSYIWVNVCDTPVLDAGRPVAAVAVAIDITQRKKAEDALRKSKDLLEKRVRERTRELRAANKDLQDEILRRKGLEGEILEISDREQQRLGQEIHDGLCQHLTAVAFMARSVALRLKNHRVIEVGDIEKIAQLVNDAATDTRNLSRALHRIDVDSAGFVTAMQDLVDREIWRIPCRLEVKPSFHIEDDMAAGELYRIAREAVINANKHSKAREIVIRLERAAKEMVLRVIDDGVGFPSEAQTSRGLGAHIMDYRARLIRGRLEIKSQERGGTCVSCYLPDHGHPSRKTNGKKNDPSERLPAKIAKRLATLLV